LLPVVFEKYVHHRDNEKCFSTSYKEWVEPIFPRLQKKPPKSIDNGGFLAVFSGYRKIYALPVGLLSRSGAGVTCFAD
jgi:hypothetical protein